MILSVKSYFSPFFLILCFFLWSDAFIDPALTLRVTYISFFLFFSFLYAVFTKQLCINSNIFLQSKTMWFLLGYLFCVCVSVLQSVNKSVSFFELSKLFLFFILACFLINRNLLQPDKFIYQLCNLIVISSIIFLVIGYAELIYYTDFFSKVLEGYIVHATFGNRNILAEMMLLFLPFQFIVQKNQINKKSKLLLWCLVFLSILFLILTESRSCWLAFILASLFILCFIFSPQKIKNLLLIAKKQNQKTFWLLVLISVAGLVYALDRVQGRLAYTLLNPNNFNSINERFMWWGKTVEMIKDYPFLGVGPGNWKIILPQYGLTGTRAEEGLVYFTQPHNDFLWIAAESGIIALLMYLLFLFHLVFIAIRILKKNIFSENEKALSGAVLFGLVSYITISSFAFPKDRMEHLIVLAIYAAILISIYCRKMINVQDFSLKKVVLVFCVLLFCSVVGIMNMKGDYHAKKAEQYRLSGNYNKVIEEASIAKNYFYTVTPQAIPVEYLSGIALYHKGNYKEAICFFESALNKNPNHILSLYFLATSFAMEENEISAVDYYQKVLVISNKLDIANVNLAISYFNLGKFKEALARLSLIKNMQHVKSNIELIKNVLIKNGYPQAEKWSDYKIEVFFKELAKNRNP